MNLTNLFKIAFKALSNNKLRGFLTMLGIIIGVGSVITMLAIGQGSKRSIQAQISEMGSNMIMIHPGGDRRGGVRLDAADMESLKLKDLEDIQAQARYISYISPSVNSSGQAIFGANNTPTTVYGISPEYLDIRRYKVEDGDIFSEQDVKTAAKVCLVGKSVVDELFPDGESPVGKVIRFGKIPLRIVGVLESKGYNSMGMDQDDLILAPYTTVQKRILAITHLQSITCSALSEEYTDQAIEEITQILRTNHKLKATDEDDFTIRSQQELSSMLTSTTDMMTLLLAAVAGISLLVAGVMLLVHLFFRFGIPPRPHHPPMERPWQDTMFFFLRNAMLYLLVVGVSVAIRMTGQWYRAENIRKDLERSRSEAELQNLKSQLNPHFLFNTLNNIYSLIQLDPDRAQQTVHDLSRLLRYVLYDSSRPTVPLKAEMDFLGNYIELMRIRLPRHVRLDVSLPENPSHTLVAPLLFISLVENAFKHGVSNDRPSFIDIDIREEEGVLACRIENSFFPKSGADRSGSGIGLANLCRRLEMIYPGRYEMKYGQHGDTYETLLRINLTDR